MSASLFPRRPSRWSSAVQPQRCRCWGLLVGWLVVGLLTGVVSSRAACAASRDEDEAVDAADLTIESVSLGFEGYYKIGFWTNIAVTVSSGATNRGTLRVICPDGDGTETVFDLLPAAEMGAAYQEFDEELASFLGLIRVGRLDVALRLQWVDDQGKVTSEWPLADFVTPVGLRSTDELMIVLGDADPILAAMTRSKAADSDRFLVDVENLQSIPTLWLGWDAVDRLIINPSTEITAASLNANQKDAIETWVRQGGDVALSMGARAAAILSEADRLESRLLPGSFEKVVEHPDSAGFETYALANDQLLAARNETIAIARLTELTGQVEAFEGRDEFDLPLVVRSPFGLGQVTFLAIDIDEPHFASWEGRNRFLAKVLQVEGQTGDANNLDGRGGRVSHLGYTDLCGQLRSAMDRFQGVQMITFTWVAVLIVLFILCIGPADYFLLKRVVKRMEWTWLTFSLIVVLFCGIAIVTLRFTKGDRVQINSVEVVDVDLASQTVRGNLWLTVYSPTSRRYTMRYAPQTSESATIHFADQLLGWQGLPGSGLGGMDSAIATSVVGQPYECELIHTSNGLISTLKQVPIQVASTKTFYGRWSGNLASRDSGELILDSRSDSLSGTITNPLDVKLSNCVVLYGTWAYVVEGDFEPGATINIERDTTERTLDAFLTRRRLNGSRDETKEWDPTSEDTTRIVEMLSFFEAAGGEDFTSLTQRLHHNLDLSSHLTPDRAILIGTAPERTMNVELTEQDTGSIYDQSLTYYRLVVPVRDPYGRDMP